ncbi:pentapeptide repeat-containing protein [Promicromonospora kroppenstedtii]|uniref:Pentapeptide repeat-containing protein n=1 Tax=Promicromonospora kroppenstedtii TaxID=440482 RepID=A0ABW7XJM5_9MICO
MIRLPATELTVRAEDWYSRDLTGEDHMATLFADVDMTEATGTGATFDSCVFCGVRLNSAHLTEIAFTSCVFDACVFFDTTLERCKLVGSQFNDCRFDLLKVEGGNWSFTDLHRAALAGARFDGVRLREADLSGIKASGAVLLGCDLSGADLAEADLSDADLRGSDLSALDPLGANLTGAVVGEAQAILLAERLGLVVRPD